MTQLMEIDLMVLTETKILDEVYCKNRLGYDLVCSKALLGQTVELKEALVCLQRKPRMVGTLNQPSSMARTY